MIKALSALEEYLLNKGEESGFQKGEEFGFKRAVLAFIQNKVSGKFSKKKIIEDIQNSFGVDVAKAEEYLENAVTNNLGC